MITIPTVSVIRDQIITDIESKIGQTVPALPKAFFRALATALAGVISLMYRFGAWVYNQIFPQTAGIEALLRIGQQYGINRNGAVAAEVTVEATGSNDTTIPDGTLWQFNGVVYEQDGSVAIAAGVATLTLTSLTTGDDTNIDTGELVSLVTPIAGVDTDAEVQTTVSSGEDAETVENYRTRVLVRLQQRPQGGATPDYISWALEVPGIVKAFAFNTDPGEVTVYPLIALSGTRLPGGPKIAEVDAYLEDDHRKPLCATVVTASMTERVISMNVSSITPDNADMRDDVEAAWTAYLLRAFPKQYEDEALSTEVISLASMYAEAIGAGARGIVAVMSIDVDGVITQHTLDQSEIIKLGTVTWPV